MSRLRFDISVSLDGYVAGPNASVDVPLGEGGEQLHQWIVGLASWRDPHGLEGGETGADDAVVQEAIETTGAVLMGRKMFSGGDGPWEDDPNRDGWWGDEPPFEKPVFILTHHARDPVTYPNGTIFTFVTDGIESALQQARAAAGDRAVSIGGGADVAQQYLAAGLIDEIELHVVPVLLGDGVRLFGATSAELPKLEPTRVVDSPTVTHLRYRVVR
jgi:dihydrofolate reductase